MELMNIDEILYFNFMQQEEEKQRKVNVENENDLVGVEANTNEEKK